MRHCDFEKFLFELNAKPIKIVDKSIDFEDYVTIDLSITNSVFKKEYSESSEEFRKYIDAYLLKTNAEVVYGGYNEERAIYKRSTHFKDFKVEERNIHLGLDLWLNANSNIYTPLDATVYGFSDNAGLGNYGPTLILKHDIKGAIFYTLYGHLSRESLTNLKIGNVFLKGEKIATLGTAKVNGDYPPHLHFQIIKNIEDWTSDYPGVCSKSERIVYLQNCPNPNLLLKIQS